MFTTKEYGVKITKSSFLSLNFVKNGNVVRKYMSVDGISLTPVVLEDDVVFLFTDDTQLHIKCKVKGNVKSDLYGNSNYTANAFFQIDDNSLNQFAQKKVKGFKIGIATKNYLTETEQIFFNNVANCFKEKFRY
jgi:GR25 family glycosyltransferase involved in LPS biosynthesis